MSPFFKKKKKTKLLCGALSYYFVQRKFVYMKINYKWIIILPFQDMCFKKKLFYKDKYFVFSIKKIINFKKIIDFIELILVKNY